MIDADRIIVSDHKGFIIKFNLHSLLKIKISPQSGMKDIKTNIDCTRVKEKIEEAFAYHEVETMVKGAVMEEDHNHIDKIIVHIIEKIIKEVKPKQLNGLSLQCSILFSSNNRFSMSAEIVVSCFLAY